GASGHMHADRQQHGGFGAVERSDAPLNDLRVRGIAVPRVAQPLRGADLLNERHRLVDRIDDRGVGVVRILAGVHGESRNVERALAAADHCLMPGYARAPRRPLLSRSGLMTRTISDGLAPTTSRSITSPNGVDSSTRTVASSCRRGPYTQASSPSTSSRDRASSGCIVTIGPRSVSVVRVATSPATRR